MITKRCSGCKQLKSIDEFHWRSKKLNKRINRCKSCSSEWSKNHYKKNKKMYVTKAAAWNRRQQQELQSVIIEYLRTHSCVDCGETDILVLEFDHVSGTKEGSISILVAGKCSVDTLKKEMKKCKVRCANCHARKTAKQLGYWKLKFATVV